MIFPSLVCNISLILPKSSLECNIAFDAITANGWSDEGKVVWMNEAFPSIVTKILMDAEAESSDESCGRECKESNGIVICDICRSNI